MIADRLSRITVLTGWRRLGLAFIAGLATILAFPPFSAIPVLWLTFPVLLLLLDGCASWRSAAGTGWCFGFGHFVVSFYWIANAFYVDADTFGVFAIPAVGALCAGFAFYIAVACGLVHALTPPAHDDDLPADRLIKSTARVVMFAAVWMVIEWVRGWLFTGFPWNPMATVWSEARIPGGLAVIQVTPLIGTYGLSFLTVLAAGAPAVLATPVRLPRTWSIAFAPLVVLMIIAAGGALRLSGATTTLVPNVKLRLVQADISQADRGKPALWPAEIRDYLGLSSDRRPDGTTAVIWGEAAVPPLFAVNVSEEGRRVLATAAPPNGLLITGGDRGEPDGERFYNSMYVIDPAAAIDAVYDKTHLVPFGEYMPLRWLIPFDKLTAGGDFTPGNGLTTLNVPGLPPLGPLICYEAIFSGAVTARTGPRPQWLLNLTNDAWFGMSSGPYQHFAAARLRAVEEGLPLVRVANTGISGVIDGYGRTREILGLGQRGVLDVQLPEPVASFTPFGLLRNLIPLVLATLGGIGALVYRRRALR